MRRIVMALAATALLGACAQGEDAGGGAGTDAVAPAPMQADRAQEERAADTAGTTASGGGAAAGGAPAAAGLEPPDVAATVIKTADLRVRVEHDGFGDAMGSATDVAARHGGYVVSSTRGTGETRTGAVTIRVPSDRFEAALADLRGLGEVRRERIAGEDVGQEFVDLEARLRNLEAQEAVLLRLFDEATSVADTIRIQNELSRVQLDIEQHEGRLRYLRDQTAFATISVSFSETGAGAPGTFGRAWDQAIRGVVAVAAGLVVGVGYALPLGIVAGLVLLVVRRVRRRPEGVPERA